MAGLPHYKNSKAAVNKYEPVYTNLFDVTILPPPGVGGGEILIEHVRSIGGLNTEKGSEVVEQEFKFAQRSYSSGRPTNTTVDLTVNFSLNLNDNNEMYVYKTLRDWKRLSYNPLTGEQGLKKDYSDAKMIVTMYNRVGDIFWQRTFHDVFVVGDLPELALDYSAGDPLELEVAFRSDYWTENMI